MISTTYSSFEGCNDSDPIRVDVWQMSSVKVTCYLFLNGWNVIAQAQLNFTLVLGYSLAVFKVFRRDSWLLFSPPAAHIMALLWFILRSRWRDCSYLMKRVVHFSGQTFKSHLLFHTLYGYGYDCLQCSPYPDGPIRMELVQNFEFALISTCSSRSAILSYFRVLSISLPLMTPFN